MNDESRAIAIITARGGSKRIPKKNIREFCGKPIIAYSIEAAIQSELFDEVMVSTDSEEIAEIAKQYGAKVPFLRSAKTADDYATTADVLVEVINKYKEKNQNFKYVCCLYPTAPFVTSDKIIGAMNLLMQNDEIDAVVPVVKFSFPPQRAFVIENNEVSIVHPETFQMRSQDFTPYYHDCGQYYCMEVKSFMEVKRLVLNHTAPVIVSEMEVQDIDNVEDWNLAEVKYQRMKEK